MVQRRRPWKCKILDYLEYPEYPDTKTESTESTIGGERARQRRAAESRRAGPRSRTTFAQIEHLEKAHRAGHLNSPSSSPTSSRFSTLRAASAVTLDRAGSVSPEGRDQACTTVLRCAREGFGAMLNAGPAASRPRRSVRRSVPALPVTRACSASSAGRRTPVRR